MKTKDNLRYAEFARLTELPKLEPADVQHLSPEELDEFKQLVNLRLTRLTGDRYQKEFARYQAILEPERAEILAPAVTENPGFESLLALEKIDRSQLQHLTPDEKKEFKALLENKLITTKDVERDAFIEKISALVDHDNIWEINHNRIINAMHNHLEKYGCAPGKSYLAKETGLSRPTINKHMKTLKSNPLMNEQTELFELMTKQVLGKVLQTALRGDMGAAKLYLNAMSKQNTGTGNDVIINNQHNIQVNSTVLNQQTIQQLKPEQLQQIEEIIKRSLSEKNEVN